MSKVTPAEPTLSSATFTRRIVVPMAAMIIVAIGLVVGFVVVSADGQNRLEVSSSTKLAETALNVNQRQMARNLRDYAVWEDVYRNLHVELDFDWAATDGNVGANIYEGLGYEMAFVVDPNGKTTYSVIKGVPQRADATSFIPDGLSELIEASRTQGSTVVGLLGSGSGVLMAAADVILPPSIDRGGVPLEALSTLIFVKQLGGKFLSRIGEEYLLMDLEIVRDLTPKPYGVSSPEGP